MNITRALRMLPILSLITIPAIADHNNSYSQIERRMVRQQARIEQGIHSGELTRKEARRLHNQQTYIAKLGHKFQYDNCLDLYEQRTLERKLDRASNRIYRLKHNHANRNHFGRGYNDYADRGDYDGHHHNNNPRNDRRRRYVNYNDPNGWSVHVNRYSWIQ